MADKTISIHADELEYTPEGLRTRENIGLEVGVHNRVQITRPQRRAGLPIGRGGFPHDSAFPTPPTLAALVAPFFNDLLGDNEQSIYQVYGHAQSDGSEAHNKELSDRRAEVMRAMLVGDVDAIQAVADSESWGAREQQVMLRALHCDPGLIDGELGPLSEVAVRDFQEDYIDGIFHRGGEASPKDLDLVPDGDLGPKTSKALVEAYVYAHSSLLSEERLHPTHPVVGCSEFNLLPGVEPQAAMNRRVTLVVHEQLPPFYDQAPCTLGDHSVCPVDDEKPARCLWYREHVEDSAEAPVDIHVDLRWLPLSDGRVLLSALSTLEDGEEVEFQVHRAKPIRGPEDIAETSLAEAISEPLAGIVTLGVAQVVWKPEEGFDPFDFDDWYDAIDYETVASNPMAAFGESNRLRPPLFTVRGGGSTAVSEPPGQQLHRLRLTNEDGSPATDGKTAWGVDNYGRVIQTDLDGRRPRTDVRATQERVRVMHFEPIQYRPARPKGQS